MDKNEKMSSSLEGVPIHIKHNREPQSFTPGCLAQAVAHLTQEPEVLCSITGLATLSRRAVTVVNYWGKYVHKVLVISA